MADVPLASLLASGLAPAPPPSPEAIRGALAQTLLQRPGDDPIAELSAQRMARADPMAFAMGIMGGPRGMPMRAAEAGIAQARQPYAGVPDALMGFRKSGPNTPFEEQNWSFTQPVRVKFSNDEFEDAVKGLNQAHALERARRNWPGALIEPVPSR